MAKLSMTRRSFVKANAVAAAASMLSFAGVASPALADEEFVGTAAETNATQRIRSCCRACGKVECGVWVTVQDGVVIKSEGDETNSHSRGHCCAKSQSSMLALYHPDRLRYTMQRTNPKGDVDPGWQRVTLAEGFDIIGEKFNEIVEKYNGYANFSMGGTSRVWAQPPYGTLGSVFPTNNKHLAYEICKGPRHFGGILTDEIGSPWMEVEQGMLVYLQWGTASEYSNYDSTNRTVVDCSQRAYKHILVDPRMTPLGKEADIWCPLRVGTDLCLSLCWNRWVVDNEAYDDYFVRRWTNGPFLWNPEEGGRTSKGWTYEMSGGVDLTTRIITEADCDLDWIKSMWTPDEEGYRQRRYLVWDENNNRFTYWDAERCQWEGEKHKIPTTGTWIEHAYKPLMADCWLPDPSKFADPADSTYDAYWNEGNEKGKTTNPEGLPKCPALTPGGVKVKIKDMGWITAYTVWEAWIQNLEDYTLEYTEEVTEVPQDKIEEGIKVYATRLNPLYGNGGIHYQLAPDQTGHAVQNTRSLQILAILTGNSDEPAGNRGSSKAEVDGCCGRANMKITDHDPQDWLIRDGVSSMELGDTGRDLSIEEQIPLIQNFVKYLQEENSPLMERYGYKIPSDEDAHFIAWRKGGSYRSSRAWPSLTTAFDSNVTKVCAERFPLLRFWNKWSDSSCIWDSINEIDVPYQIHGGICMSGDYMNESNLIEAWEALSRIDLWVDTNLWSCPNNGCCDVVFACTHWMETNTGRVSQGAGGIFGAGQRATYPIGDVVYDPTFVICLHRAIAKFASGLGAEAGYNVTRDDVPEDRWACVWNDRDLNYDGWNNLKYEDFVQCGGTVTYEEQEYRVLEDAVDWWVIEEAKDINDRDGAADIRALGESGHLVNAEAWAVLPEIDIPNERLGLDWPRYAAKFQEEGWFDCRKWHPERWGTYRRWEMGYRRQMGGYNLYQAVDEKCAFFTCTGLVEIWSQICESYVGDDTSNTITYNWIVNPDRYEYGFREDRIPDIDKFPHYFETNDTPVSKPEWYDVDLVDTAENACDWFRDVPHMYDETTGTMANGYECEWASDGTPSLLQKYKDELHNHPGQAFFATSGSRQPVYFHSEHRQLPWCRELWPSPRLEMNPLDAAKFGLEQGMWVWVRTPWGAIREVLDLYYGIKQGTVNCNHHWWYPEMDIASHGFDLVNINSTMSKYGQDWICGASRLRGNPILIYEATEENSPFGVIKPAYEDLDTGEIVECISDANDERLKQWLANDPRVNDATIDLSFAPTNPEDALGLMTDGRSIVKYDEEFE